MGTLYVADPENNRIMRWPKGAKQGRIIIIGRADEAAPFNGPAGLSFDHHGNLYVADETNHRVRRFDLQGLHCAD
ncbi:unnamed protein product [Rotaria sp. Silwood2]|nr:unnamed protein product [Rotaria sp. Silwood2]CAF3029987.1 unnamed protein product [Rotaria sp. Silwood2]CAF3354667.1 unnamed protein product [Rotaria sp. Silwood2]CAF4066397.1 unnamed protein product [Rotaria sp. Silwood2]CAF4175844.1 unnamed protein product [Rotaria sp. Silwood2]